MPFTADDIEPDGYVPGTTALAYAVSRAGEHVGRVHSFAAFGWLNSGEDPRERIAKRLNEVEESEGFEQLANALRATLDLG
jgi:hypothetical protein